MNSDLSQTCISQWFHWNKAPQELSGSKTPESAGLVKRRISVKNGWTWNMNLKFGYWQQSKRGAKWRLTYTLCCCFPVVDVDFLRYFNTHIWAKYYNSWFLNLNQAPVGVTLAVAMICPDIWSSTWMLSKLSARVWDPFWGVNHRRGR